MRAQVEAAGLAGSVLIDSAGTGDWHVGEAPDARAQAAAHRRGYDLSPLRARQVTAVDFERFDLLLAMDEENLRNLLRVSPLGMEAKARLLMEFGGPASAREIADPYFGAGDGFELVLDQCEHACRGLLAHLQASLAGEPA